MPEKIKIRVKKSNISQPAKDQTTISHLPLVNGLVAAPIETWQLVATIFAPVNPEHVEIDEAGRVVIRDANFAAAVKRLLDSPALQDVTEGNVGCANVLAKCAEDTVEEPPAEVAPE